MELTRRTLEALSDLTYELYTCPFEKHSHADALIVSFKGEYGYGSQGNGDAGFMTAIIKAGLSAFEPLALIIDLREMKYEWGDLIIRALGAGDDQYVEAPFPTAVLASELNREGLTSLITHEMEGESPAKWLYETLEGAMSALEEEIGWMDAT
jgi:hypothetical protein